MIEYREIIESDATNFLNLMLKLDDETEFMMYEAGERSKSVHLQITEIRKIISSNNSTIFLALDDDNSVGFIVAEGGNYRRNSHNCYLAVGILNSYTGKGVGKALFAHIFEWGEKHNITRFELTVMCHNNIAISLYKKLGFEIEGVKRNSLVINSKSVDEYYMRKIFNS